MSHTNGLESIHICTNSTITAAIFLLYLSRYAALNITLTGSTCMICVGLKKWSQHRAHSKLDHIIFYTYVCVRVYWCNGDIHDDASHLCCTACVHKTFIGNWLSAWKAIGILTDHLTCFAACIYIFIYYSPSNSKIKTKRRRKKTWRKSHHISSDNNSNIHTYFCTCKRVHCSSMLAQLHIISRVVWLFSFFNLYMQNAHI